MNRLWVRLSIAFAVVLAISFLMIGVFIRVNYPESDQPPPEAIAYFEQIQYQRIAPSPFVAILIIGGLGVWAFARPAYHIGASGLIFGYFGFLVAIGLYERSISSLVIASVTLFFYGGLILGILPTDSFISWEGHLFGLCAGIIAARLTVFRRQPADNEGAQDV